MATPLEMAITTDDQVTVVTNTTLNFTSSLNASGTSPSVLSNSTNFTLPANASSPLSVVAVASSTKSPNYNGLGSGISAQVVQNFSVVLLDTGVTDMVIRAIFLGLFTVLGFIGNCILLATLAQSRRRRGMSPLNLLLISLASVNLVDCLLNMPLVLGASITQQWDYGEAMCRVNAFSVQFVSMASAVGLAVLCVDRCVGVYCAPDAALGRYESVMTLTKVNLLIVYTWVHAAALNLPLVADLISTRTLKARYLCAVSGVNTVIYICLSLTLGYILPMLLIGALFISIICKNFKEKKRKRKRKLDRNYPAKVLMADRTLRKEINTAKFTGVLTALWVVLVAPYLLLSYLQQYTDSGYGSLSYPWQLDLSLTWIRFSYPLCLPLLTFCWRREVWRKFKSLCLRRKGNHVDDELVKGDSPGRKDSLTVSVGNNDSVAIRKKQPPPPLAFDVPVLFATEQGIHVQTLSKRPKALRSPLTPEHFNNDDGPFSEAEKVVDDLGESRASGIVTARHCDVNGSQDLLQIEDDTSDYDSVADEEDSLGVSHGTVSGDVDAGSNYKPKSSTSTRHDSDILLIAESQKSFDNEAFEPDSDVEEQKRPMFKAREEKTSHVKLNSKDSAGDVHSLGNMQVILPEDEKSMRHVRSSSDSGRGSEEGTMPRIRERVDITAHAVTVPYANVKDAITNESSTDLVPRPSDISPESEEQPRVKKKKRKRKKIPKDEESEFPPPSERTLPKLADPNTNNLIEMIQSDKHVHSRPPIRLKPLDRPPSPAPVHEPPSPTNKIPKKLPSPYKSSRVGSANGMQRSPTKVKSTDLLQPDDNVSVKHQRSDSEASAILEVEPASAPPAGTQRSAARRRRRTQSANRTLPVTDSSHTAASNDVTDNGDSNTLTSRTRHGSSGSERSQENRLTQSDSAADLRLRAQNSPEAETRTRRSPKPSPRPRRPRRKSDIPARADGKPPTGAS